MIYREAGVAIRRALLARPGDTSNSTGTDLSFLGEEEQDDAASLHPENLTRLRLPVEPTEAAYDK
jgi:hypothetical protein